MCTVISIPGNDTCIFASLRDENPARPKAWVPEIYVSDAYKYLAPKDPVAGGTWIGITENGHAVILLNGGFENHSKKKYYRKSRGLIVTELLSSSSPVICWSLMELEDIEPFTLIVWADKNLFQLVWDGTRKYRTLLDSKKSHIWSSATLYNTEAKAKRSEVFQNWIAMDPPITKLSLLNFFKSHTDTNNGYIINRDELCKTLSYTFVELFREEAEISYYDLIDYKYSNNKITFHNNNDFCSLEKACL